MTGTTARPRVLVVQHQADCAPARLGRWLTEAGCELDVRHPWRGEALPARPDADGLLVLGGSMGAEDDLSPDPAATWLGAVKDLVRAAVADDVPTLGVCLGHQLVASALGGRVAPSPRGQTVGLTEVGWSEDAADDALVAGLVGARRAIHWNDDVITVEPPGTVALARTEAGDLQVARFAPSAWGVQAHPEADRAVVEPWAAGDAERHRASGIDQATVLEGIAAAEPELEAAWRPLGTAFARLCGAGR